MKIVVSCERTMKKIFSAVSFRSLNSRKKLVATANRREGVYNRTGEPSVTFATEEEQQRECALTFVKKSEQAIHSLLRHGAGDRT